MISLGLIKRETSEKTMYERNGDSIVFDSNPQYIITDTGQKLRDILQQKIFDE